MEYSIKRRDSFKGHYSFLTRNANSKVWLQELNVVNNDSIKLTPELKGDFYPYEIAFNQNDVELELFTKIEDSLFWLNTSGLLPQGMFQSDELTSAYGDYIVLPFLKKNEISIFVKSDKKVTLKDDNNKLEFTNEIGEIKLEVLQMSEGIIKFKFNFDVKSRFIEGADNVNHFKELLQKYSEFKNKKWVVKL